MVLSSPGVLRRVPGRRIVLRKDAPIKGKVTLVSGAGSGHEPGHVGYVGRGMLDAAAMGDVFSAPAAGDVLTAIQSAEWRPRGPPGPPQLRRGCPELQPSRAQVAGSRDPRRARVGQRRRRNKGEVKEAGGRGRNLRREDSWRIRRARKRRDDLPRRRQADGRDCGLELRIDGGRPGAVHNTRGGPAHIHNTRRTSSSWDRHPRRTRGRARQDDDCRRDLGVPAWAASPKTCTSRAGTGRR